MCFCLCRPPELHGGIFLAALDGRGQVCAADSSSDAPTLHEADRAFVVPPVSHPEYIGHILELCRQDEVGLLLSLNDLKLPLLARHRERFRDQGTGAVVSLPKVKPMIARTS
jgi:carbamoyl-phosphate synthase large subunit